MLLKKIFLSLFLIVSLNANEILNEKIENLIGSKEYATHQNLIKFIFKKEFTYTTTDGLNYHTILKTLQENGLLHLNFGSPKDIEIAFVINGNPIKSLKILKDTLKSIGYYNYFTKNTSYDVDENLVWTIKLKTEAAIDPLIFIGELFKNETRVLDITKEENDKWVYSLNTENSTMAEAVYINNNERVAFSKPLSAYFLKIDEASKIYIASRKLNKWLPYVVFYDKDLNVLKVSQDDKVYRNITLSIPQDTRYIKITDLYTLFNIKRGLSVVIKE